MEFPNPEDKRARTIRLFTGYALVAVFIGLASLILVYLAQGYGYDPNKGVQRSGLVFFASSPVSATVYVDNQEKDKTDLRLTLGEGVHSVSLKQEKYRDWNKTISVDGGSVYYLVYPKLFPTDIKLGINKAYANSPLWQSQSPDKRWLVMQTQSSNSTLTSMDLLKPTNEPVDLVLPESQLIKNSDGKGTFTPIDWSEDNRHLLIKQTLSDGKTAYIIVDREDVSQTQNISTKLSLANNINLTLRDKKYDKYYAFTPETGALTVADLKSGLQTAPIASNVVSFKPYADNIVLYVTYAGAKDAEASVKILSNKTDVYNLQSLKRDPKNQYILDVSSYGGKYYYITASHTDNFALLYRDPLATAKPDNTDQIKPRLSLNISNPEFASFSDNMRFICLQTGKQFVLFDAELNRVYRYQSSLAIAPAGQQAKWMDAYRLSVVTDGKAQVFDFDGVNVQALTTSKSETPPYFDKDYKYIYTFINQADGRVGMQNGSLVVD